MFFTCFTHVAKYGFPKLFNITETEVRFISLLVECITYSVITLIFWCFRMANLCAKHSGVCAHQVVGKERVSFLPSLLGNSRKQLKTNSSKA